MKRDEVLVWLAGVPWDAVKGTDRHLVERLGRHVPVLWVDPPRSVVRAFHDRAVDATTVVQEREVSEGVTRLTILAPPFPQRSGVARLSDHALARGIERRLRRCGTSVAAVVGASPYTSLDVVRRERRCTRVYFATDDFVAGAPLFGRRSAAVARVERARLRESDCLVAVSDPILARWGRPGHVLPNGCDVAAFGTVQSVTPERAGLSTEVPVAGVVGQLSSRLDLTLLEAVARQPIGLLLVGPVAPDIDRERFERLVGRRNVAWAGQQPFESLPGYLAGMDVGLTPYVDTAFNRASFPLKTLEYLAAGRPVVSTPLPAVHALRSPYVCAPASAERFATEAVRLAAGQSTARIAEIRAWAGSHDWSVRAERLLKIVLGR